MCAIESMVSDKKLIETDDHRANGFALLKAKLRRLPPVHYAVLKAIVEHLARVAAHAGKNKMDVKNISIVFGGVIFGEDELPKNAGGAELLAMGSYQVRLGCLSLDGRR
jgi:hypothetical protein